MGARSDDTDAKRATPSPATTREALALLIYLVCSEEGVLFVDSVTKHHLRRNKDQGTLLAAYTLGQWASGKIPDSSLRGPIGKRLSKGKLKNWALAFASVSSYFKNYNIEDPIKFLLTKELIRPRPDGIGFSPNEEKIKNFFLV